MYFKKILLAIIALGLVGLAVFAYYVNKVMFTENTAFDNKTAYVYISREDSYSKVIDQLTPLLKDIKTFDALAKQKKYDTHVKSGRFVIERGMNNNAIINSIRSNNIPLRISFNNQHDIEKLAVRLSEQLDFSAHIFLESVLDSSFLASNNFKRETILGMFIPNSYDVYWDTTPENFRQKMVKEYLKFWNASRLNKAKHIGLSPIEVISLASIVHEESKQILEQPTIAGVYLNRLKIQMPLQADPTLKFALYHQENYEGKEIKRILNKHKLIESPYNTYKYTGLPPGPIAMPDISAIDAVLNPDKHRYIYFVANPSKLGYHTFAKTLSEHNRNARKYHNYLNSKHILN